MPSGNLTSNEERALRHLASNYEGMNYGANPAAAWAVAEIERLRAQVERLSIGSRGNVWEEVRALRAALAAISGAHSSAFRSYKEDAEDFQRIAREALSGKRSPDETSGVTAADYEEVLASHRRLVRELDVLLNGDGAAQQASLCDVVAQLASIKRSCPITWSHLQDALRHEEQCAPQNGSDQQTVTK